MGCTSSEAREQFEDGAWCILGCMGAIRIPGFHRILGGSLAYKVAGTKLNSRVTFKKSTPGTTSGFAFVSYPRGLNSYQVQNCLAETAILLHNVEAETDPANWRDVTHECRIRAV